MHFSIRPYTPEDRAAVRNICCETGFMGDPIEPIFKDREAFADFFTRYYTDYEPENCRVAEAEGKVVGYLIGCHGYKKYPFRQAWIAVKNIPGMIARALRGRYDLQSFRFLGWFLFRASSETPASPKNAAHFHINLLPDWRDGIIARRLIFSFIRDTRAKGINRIYGQIQTYGDHRSPRLFERYGYHCYDSKRITKFERFGKKDVYVSTIFKDYSVA